MALFLAQTPTSPCSSLTTISSGHMPTVTGSLSTRFRSLNRCRICRPNGRSLLNSLSFTFSTFNPHKRHCRSVKGLRVEIFCARAGNTTRPLTAVTGLYYLDGLRHTCPKPLIASNPAHLNTLLMFNLRYSALKVLSLFFHSLVDTIPFYRFFISKNLIKALFAYSCR